MWHIWLLTSFSFSFFNPPQIILDLWSPWIETWNVAFVGSFNFLLPCLVLVVFLYFLVHIPFSSFSSHHISLSVLEVKTEMSSLGSCSFSLYEEYFWSSYSHCVGMIRWHHQKVFWLVYGFHWFYQHGSLIFWGKPKVEGNGNYVIGNNRIFLVLEQTFHISQTKVGKLSECDFGKSKCYSPSIVVQTFQSSLFCLRPRGDSCIGTYVDPSIKLGTLKYAFDVIVQAIMGN